MATYATSADLTKQFGSEQILLASDRDGDGVADADVIDAAIETASKYIDSYLSVRFDLPLSSSGDVLVRPCCDLAMYFMSADSGALTDEKKERYKDTRAWLKDIAKGVAELGEDVYDETAHDVPQLSTDNPDRQFTRTKMDGLL